MRELVTRTAQDALHSGLNWRCPSCQGLVGRTQADGSVLHTVRHLGDSFPNGEMRFVTYGGTIAVVCRRCGTHVVFRVSGASVVV